MKKKKKITDHDHDKYITTPEFNTLSASVFKAIFARVNSVKKTDFDNRVSSIQSKITANKTKNESLLKMNLKS